MACLFIKTPYNNVCKQRHLVKQFSIFNNAVITNGDGSEFHGTAVGSYPNVALKLPDNYQDINASEVGQFSPLRSREISGSVINSNVEDTTQITAASKIDITLENDPHVEPYDCRGAVNLSSSMQSNVPSPFGGQKSILGMPGSQWGQGYKYLSDYLHHSHYLNLRNSYSRALHSVSMKKGTSSSYHTIANTNHKAPSISSLKLIESHILNTRKIGHNANSKKDNASNLDSSIDESKQDNIKPQTRADKLKMAVAAYGSTVIVFHITISLISLGGFYLLVSSGLDVMYYLDCLGLGDKAINKITANTGTFVLAYAIHKVFAPARIGITLTATPFIVRHLRKIGLLKAPVKK